MTLFTSCLRRPDDARQRTKAGRGCQSARVVAAVAPCEAASCIRDGTAGYKGGSPVRLFAGITWAGPEDSARGRA